MRLIEVLLVTLGGIWQGVRQDFNLVEITLIAAGFWAWKRGKLPTLPEWRWTGRPWVGALAIAVGAVAVRLALIPALGVPVPVVTDEFSHFLLADTLLHGRAANPTHPFWQHFESLHIIQQPHYVSNYFPGHALVLAAARATIGNPWAGILVECGIFLAVLYWMLQGWMPGRWAVFGVFLAALRFGIGSYWVNAYHGGFLPAIGGALVAGAFPRLLKRASIMQGCVLGIGLAILASTRPFEGFFFSLPILGVIAWRARGLVKIAVPVVLIAGAAMLALGAYFERVTGSPLVTTYQISQKTYGWPMGLAWRKPPPMTFRHIELQRYYEYELGEREKVDGPVDLVEYLAFRMQEYWRFFLGPVLTIPLVMIGRVWKRERFLFFGLLGALAAVLLEGAASPHYLAPATAVIVAIIVECCRYVRAAKIPLLPPVTTAIPAAMILVLTLRIAAQPLGLPYTQALNYQSWCCKVTGNLSKSRIERNLELKPGKHLVFVKAKTDPYNLFQWIYNDADIDDSRIVWARDLGAERNAQLIAYFAGRQVWVVDPNVNPAVCTKY